MVDLIVITASPSDRKPAEGHQRQADDSIELELASIRANYPALHDLPAAVLLNVGAYDRDCAGGCG